MFRVLKYSHSLFRSLSHVNKPFRNTSYYLLQRYLTTQTSQDIVKLGSIDIDQLYQRSKKLIAMKRDDIERSIVVNESELIQDPPGTIPDSTRFPTPKRCSEAENHRLGMENALERDLFLMSLVMSVMKPNEPITIHELVDRLNEHYQDVILEYQFVVKVSSKTKLFKWLVKPIFEENIIINSADMKEFTLMIEKKSKKERILKVFDNTTIQWTGASIEKVVEKLSAKNYGLEEFPSEAKLYLPHVSVTAEEAKRAKLSSDQLRKLDEEIMHYYETSRLPEESIVAFKEQATRVENALRLSSTFKKVSVDLFGSAANGLATHGSDVDLCVSGSAVNKALSKSKSPAIVQNSIGKLVRKLGDVLKEKGGMKKIITVERTRIPIVKFYDPVTNMECDLSVYNHVSVRNTELFKAYTQVDPRVAPLIFAVKRWARSRKLTEPWQSNTVNSYTHVLMLLAFLIMERVIPPLQQICCNRPIEDHIKAFHQQSGDEPTCLACQRPLPTVMIESYNTYFYTKKPKPSPNTKTVGELLVDFFRFYAFEFSYLRDCVSPRIGGMISRSVKGWEYHKMITSRGADGAPSALCVEDPFILNRNCADTATQWAVSGIRWEHERALRALLSGRGLEGAAAPWTRWNPAIYQRLGVYQPLK